MSISNVDMARLRCEFYNWVFERDGEAVSAKQVEGGRTKWLLIWHDSGTVYKSRVHAWPASADEREPLNELVVCAPDPVKAMRALLAAIKSGLVEAIRSRIGAAPAAHQASGSRDDGQPLELPAGRAVVALDHHTGQGLEMAAALRELADALEAGRVPYLCVAGWLEAPSGDPDEASAVRITTYDSWQAGLALSGLIQIQSQRLTARLAGGEGEGEE